MPCGVESDPSCNFVPPGSSYSWYNRAITHTREREPAMSRLDQHIAKVQTKLALRDFGQYFARTTFVMGLLVLLAVIVQKFYQIFPGNIRVRWMIIGGIVVCAAVSAVWAYIKRPSRE